MEKLNFQDRNPYSKALFITGWIIIILGFIGSIVLGNANKGYDNYDVSFNFSLFLIGALSSVISGLMILGLAEIINILDQNRKYLKSLVEQKGSSGYSSASENVSSIADELPEI